MTTSVLSGPSVALSDPIITEILERYDAYVRILAWKKVPRNIVPPEKLRDEIEELAQRVRVKLWHALRQHRILKLKTYIHLIVLSEVIDMVRKYHPTFSLPLDDDGELSQGNMMITTSSIEMQDPAYIFEQTEAFDVCMRKAIEGILKLPPRQQYAMICALKDRPDDTLPLIGRLKRSIRNFDEIHWPEEKRELQTLRASLAVARKKLRCVQSSAIL